MVMRHTERLDEFFPDWISKNMNHPYRPFDLNMPMALPIQRPPQAYQSDPPITNTGDILARLIARGIVEPGLFESFNNYPMGLPGICTQQRAQFNVDENYTPHTKLEDLTCCKNETNDDYNTRVRHSLIRISKIHEISSSKKDQLILIVGHAQTVDIAAGTFAKKLRHSSEVDLCWDQVKIPYGGLLVLERIEGRKGWTPNLYAIPPVNYRNVTTQFDTGFVLREGEKHYEKREQSAAAK
ncbi:hypothetical protein OSTOST_08952 [Ostertagia ostertagi]